MSGRFSIFWCEGSGILSFVHSKGIAPKHESFTVICWSQHSNVPLYLMSLWTSLLILEYQRQLYAYCEKRWTVVESCSLCLHDSLIIIRHDFYIMCFESDYLFLRTSLCVMSITACVFKSSKTCGASWSNKLLVKMESSVSDCRYIGLEAHMYFVDFTEGHCQPMSPNDFPEVSTLINYDLVCLTVKMRRDTNNHGIILFKNI